MEFLYFRLRNKKWAIPIFLFKPLRIDRSKIVNFFKYLTHIIKFLIHVIVIIRINITTVT